VASDPFSEVHAPSSTMASPLPQGCEAPTPSFLLSKPLAVAQGLLLETGLWFMFLVHLLCPDLFPKMDEISHETSMVLACPKLGPHLPLLAPHSLLYFQVVFVLYTTVFFSPHVLDYAIIE